MARLVFAVCWLPLYGIEVLSRPNLGTLARFVSPVFGVTLQLLIAAWLMVLWFKLFKLGGSRSGQEPTDDQG